MARASSRSISPASSSAIARPARTAPIVAFLDAATWLAQIAMFVLLGLLAWPERLPQRAAAGARGGADADADRAARRGVGLPCAVPLQPAGEAVHLLGRLARRGLGVPRLDPDAGGLARRALLLRRRLRRGGAVARRPGLDHRRRRRSSCASACRAPMSMRTAPSSICPARSSMSWSAIRWSPTARICAAASRRPGPSSRWWCATSAC